MSRPATLQWGAIEPSPVVSPILFLGKDHRPVLEILTPEREIDLAYCASNYELPELVPLLQSGEISSVLLTWPEIAELQAITVCKPGFLGDPSTLWSGVADGLDTLLTPRMLRAVVETPGLLYAALSVGDMLGLNLEHLPVVDVENFPWDSEELIEGAVKQQDGRWVIRQGRA